MLTHTHVIRKAPHQSVFASSLPTHVVRVLKVALVHYYSITLFRSHTARVLVGTLTSPLLLRTITPR